MFNRSSSMLWALPAAALLLCGPAAAGAGGEWTTNWHNGFHVSSSDGAFKLKFGGRLQADATFVSGDGALSSANADDGFEFRRARLFMSGTIYERISFKAQYDFAGGTTSIKDLWVGIDNDWGRIRFGHFKEPFSLEELTSSKYITFLERSLPVGAFAMSRNSGFGIGGHRGDRFNWAAGAFYDADSIGRSGDSGNIDLTGRVGFRPIYEDGGERLLHLGLAVSRRQRGTGETFRFRSHPEAHFAPRLVDTGSFAADNATVIGAEIAGVFGSLWFSGEYMSADVSAPAFGDPTFDGAYVQAGYFLTGEHRRFKTSHGAFDRTKPRRNFLSQGGPGAWEIAARWSTVDLTDADVTGGQQDDVTIGVNWYPNPATRLMFDWVHADVSGSVDQGDMFLMRWQVDF